MSKDGLSRRDTLAGTGAALAAAALAKPAFATGHGDSGGDTKMALDMTGGLPPESEYVLTEFQTAKGMQEGINWWLWDDAGEFCMPRFAVECMTPDWDMPQIQLSFVSADGQRLLRSWSKAPVHKKLDAAGNASHFGSGPLWFDCIEPFHRYRARYEGSPLAGTFTEMLAPEFSTEKLGALQFDIEAETVVPPWIQGSMSGDAKERMKDGTVEGEFMGGDRLEQLMKVKGTINYDGRVREFTGGALRIRRAGIRNITGFWGHCWQSAVFPSGKAFGYIAYPPRPDGAESYNEGFVFLGEGTLIPARVAKAPWLHDFQFSGEDVSLVMETHDGRQFEIGGTSFGGMPTIGRAGSVMPPLFQSIARYRWDGEEAYGMMERSNLPEKVTLPA